MKNGKIRNCFNTGKYLSAFSLSEVLISLTIIGIIAAITVPTIMNNTNGHEHRAALKKAISALNQALELEYSLEGLTAQNFVSGDEIVKELFKKRMNNIVPSAKEFTVPDCKNESPDSIFTTDDGMIFCVSNFKSDNSGDPNSKCSYTNRVPCVQNEGANIWIDVNGFRKPNKITTDASNPRDVYQALIYAQRVVPYGEPTQSIFYDKDISKKNEQNEPAEPTKPTEPTENPTEPTEPTNPGINMPTCPEDDEYCMYDPDNWDNYSDYLEWMWGLMTDNQ